MTVVEREKLTKRYEELMGDENVGQFYESDDVIEMIQIALKLCNDDKKKAKRVHIINWDCFLHYTSKNSGVNKYKRLQVLNY